MATHETGQVEWDAANCLRVDHATVEAVDALRAAGVRPVLLKGPVIAQWLYADDPSQRPTTTPICWWLRISSSVRPRRSPASGIDVRCGSPGAAHTVAPDTRSAGSGRVIVPRSISTGRSIGPNASTPHSCGLPPPSELSGPRFSGRASKPLGTVPAAPPGPPPRPEGSSWFASVDRPGSCRPTGADRSVAAGRGACSRPSCGRVRRSAAVHGGGRGCGGGRHRRVQGMAEGPAVGVQRTELRLPVPRRSRRAPVARRGDAGRREVIPPPSYLRSTRTVAPGTRGLRRAYLDRLTRVAATDQGPHIGRGDPDPCRTSPPEMRPIRRKTPRKKRFVLPPPPEVARCTALAPVRSTPVIPWWRTASSAGCLVVSRSGARWSSRATTAEHGDGLCLREIGLRLQGPEAVGSVGRVRADACRCADARVVGGGRWATVAHPHQQSISGMFGAGPRAVALNAVCPARAG